MSNNQPCSQQYMALSMTQWHTHKDLGMTVRPVFLGHCKQLLRVSVLVGSREKYTSGTTFFTNLATHFRWDIGIVAVPPAKNVQILQV